MATLENWGAVRVYHPHFLQPNTVKYPKSAQDALWHRRELPATHGQLDLHTHLHEQWGLTPTQTTKEQTVVRTRGFNIWPLGPPTRCLNCCLKHRPTHSHRSHSPLLSPFDIRLQQAEHYWGCSKNQILLCIAKLSLPTEDPAPAPPAP